MAVEYDGLVEEVLGYEEVGALRYALRPAVGVELKCEVDFMKRIGDDFVFENAVLVDDAFEVDADLDLSDFAQQQTLHPANDKILL